MRLLHLTYDYPDVINPDKTAAIKSIIDVTNDSCNTCCISLNRTTGFKKLMLKNGNVTAMNTFGLPKGIFFMFTLLKSIRRVRAAGLDFKAYDKVHAHKLTFEGPIAYYIHKKYNIPYIISIQQTDFKVIMHKPLLKGFYFKILKCADKIIIISPWIERQLRSLYGSKRMEQLTHKLSNIPLIVNRECIQKDYDNGKFLCAFHMRNSYIKIKNINRVLKAISILKKAGVIINLDIVGDGPASIRVEDIINKLDINAQVKMTGKVENDKITELMSEYKAFILCSYPETFGMVYIEALNAGIPVIYSKNAGIDGFFNGKGIGLAVQHNSIKEICNALLEMSSNHNFYKENVLKIQENKSLEMFSRASVQQKYKAVILS